MDHGEQPVRRATWWSLRRFRRVAILTVAGVALLTVAGGFVRLTGSGLGCDDWPNCNDERFIDVSSGHAAIEQGNRLLSGLIAVPTVLLGVAAWKLRHQGRRLGAPAAAVIGTVLANAVVGGIAVIVDLHPALVQSHFLLAMASIAAALVAAHRAAPRPPSTPDAMGVGRPLVGQGWALAITTALALVTGTVVTGTGPHAGDEEARRFGFDISDVARIHSLSVIAAIVAALLLIRTVQRRRTWQQRFSPALSTWMFLAVVQGAIGYVQYFNGVPEVLVGTHIAGATALWVATVALLLSVIAPLAEDTAPQAEDDPDDSAAPTSPGVPAGRADVHTPETGGEHGIAVGSSPSA